MINRSHVFSSVGELTNKIVEIEKINNLFEWQIGGVFIWELIRYQVYTMALHDNFDKTARVKHSFYYKMRTVLSKLIYKIQKNANAIIYQPFFGRAVNDALVFESSRKLLFNGAYIDPYTEFTCRDLEKQGLSFTRYQSSYSYDRLAARNANTKSLDLAALMFGLKAKFTDLTLQAFELQKIDSLAQIINRDLNISLDLLTLVKKEIKIFRLSCSFYSSLLKTKKPREVYLVNFCDKAGLIAAAKQNKIRVTDIQHGLISADDIIYNYPGVEEGSLRYFPDRFFAWDKIWSRVSKLPLKEADIINYGNKYLDNQKTRYSHVVKEPLQLMVVSQPGFTHAIAAEVLKHSKHFAGFKVLYKLHPAEYDSAFNFPEIEKLSKEHNFTFVKRDVDLYELLAASRYVLGLGSTVLIEALSFDCRVLLLDLPGVEWMAPFIDNDKVKMFQPELNLAGVNKI
jgi:hypothetical protein